MNLDDLPDEVLLNFIQRGDNVLADQAFNALYDRYAKLVWAIAKRILGSTIDASSVVNDCFFKVWNSTHAYDSTRSSVASWINVIARNTAIDHLRKHKLPLVRLENYQESLLVKDYPGSEAFWQRQILHQAIQRLEPDLKRLAQLRYLGYTQEAIAELTNQHISSIKREIERINEHLKKALSDAKEFKDETP